MLRRRTTILCMLLVAFLVVPPCTVCETAESRSVPPAPQPAPEWKVNDYFRYEYKQRPMSYQWQVTFGGTVPGTCDFTGTMDYYEYLTVTSISDATWYYLAYTRERWENGTFVFKPQSYNPSTVGNYRWYDRTISSSPMKIRKSDLATGDGMKSYAGSREYTWTDYGKWYNTTVTETAEITNDDGAMPYYDFPLEYDKTWQIRGKITSHRTGTQYREQDTYGNTQTTIYDLTDTESWFSASGRTEPQADTPAQVTPAGTFEDCYQVRIRGFYDYTETGTSSVNNVPQPPTYISQNDTYYDTTQWYSNTAGYICNYNSTQMNNGLRLSGYRYSSIPPNHAPEIQQIDGRIYTPDFQIIDVPEGKATSIGFKVRDYDNFDTLNWSVQSVAGATSNRNNATLMDDLPGFTASSPTRCNWDFNHSNSISILANQPRTVDGDMYFITINVTDGHKDGGINFTFRVRVQNVNDKPYVAMPIPEITMRENSTMTCTTWKLTDIFKDRDGEAGINDPLTFSAAVTTGPNLDINIVQDNGTVTFSVPDYWPEQVPMSGWDSVIRFTCTDYGSGNPANKTSNSTNAGLHIEHVNHGPLLSANGTDLAENGLTWLGDRPDSRLDLNKAFFDPDIRYAGDALTFSWSGEKFIGVENDDGRIILTPWLYWNGKETISFRAIDSLGGIRELRLVCTVLPVNHAPYFCETEMRIDSGDEDALTIKEADTPFDPNNGLRLAISVKDPDTIYGSDTHSCMWYVNDTNGNTVYKSLRFELNKDEYKFQAAFAGAFSASGSPYRVEVVVRDGGGLTATYHWNVKVLDMNRPPAARFISPADGGSFTEGKSIFFDASGSNDPDEGTMNGMPNIDNLTFIWSSSLQGTFKRDRGSAGAQFSYDGLKPGKHIITLTVRDEYTENTVISTVQIVPQPRTESENLWLFIMGFLAVVVLAGAIGGFAAWKKRSKAPANYAQRAVSISNARTAPPASALPVPMIYSPPQVPAPVPQVPDVAIPPPENAPYWPSIGSTYEAPPMPAPEPEPRPVQAADTTETSAPEDGPQSTYASQTTSLISNEIPSTVASETVSTVKSGTSSPVPSETLSAAVSEPTSAVSPETLPAPASETPSSVPSESPPAVSSETSREPQSEPAQIPPPVTVPAPEAAAAIEPQPPPMPEEPRPAPAPTQVPKPDTPARPAPAPTEVPKPDTPARPAPAPTEVPKPETPARPAATEKRPSIIRLVVAPKAGVDKASGSEAPPSTAVPDKEDIEILRAIHSLEDEAFVLELAAYDVSNVKTLLESAKEANLARDKERARQNLGLAERRIRELKNRNL